jgi:uronate dehydrogenase
MKKVLITGMSGLIGGILRRHFEGLGGYELSALNRRPVEGVESFQADIADLEGIKPAFEGKDVVVHLAANLSGQTDFEAQLSGNVVGTYNVYEAARLAGVSRVVFASSGATATGYEDVAPYDAIVAGRYDEVPEDFDRITHDVTWPKGIYGAVKVWGEAIGHHFSDTYGMSVLCVRIGRVNAANRPEHIIEFSRYLSHRDISQMFQKCVEAPEAVKYDVFFATSNNKWGYRDLEHPRKVIGYEPQDSAESFR